jgi:voltage-gated potassium channel
MATVVLSLYSIFFLALITGAVVTACSERLQEQRNGSIAQFLDRLERLPELSKEELTELSEQVKRFNRS